MSLTEATLLAKVGAAKRAIAEAQEELTNALAQIQGSPRAEKTHISEALRGAVARLGVAQTELAALDDSLLPEKPDPAT